MEVLDKEDIDNLKDLMRQKFVVDNLIESIDSTKYQDRELLSEAEVHQLLQSVPSSEIDGNETIPTMAQSMGIKQPKRGKLSKLRQEFDAAKVRHSDEFEALLNEKFEVPNELLSKKDIDNLIESPVDFTKYQDRELLSEAEVQQLLQSVAPSEVNENGTIPTIKTETTQADREM